MIEFRKVPPGDNCLSLYRIDWDKVQTDGLLKEGDEWTGPNEIALLTPLPDGLPRKRFKPLLLYPAASATSVWLHKYQITNGIFEGKAFAYVERDLCNVNVDQGAASS